MGKAQRDKGKRGERATAAELRKAFPEIAASIRRGWQTRQGDDDSDVIFPGYWFEVKTGKQPNIRAALRQAIDDSKGRGVPVAVIRDDRKEPMAALRWEDFLKLLEKANGAEG
jgi:hypothetical protein